MNLTLEEQIRMNHDLRQQVNVEKSVQQEQVREMRKLVQENQSLKGQLDQQIDLGGFFQTRIEELSESEIGLKQELKRLTEIN